MMHLASLLDIGELVVQCSSRQQRRLLDELPLRDMARPVNLGVPLLAKPSIVTTMCTLNPSMRDVEFIAAVTTAANVLLEERTRSSSRKAVQERQHRACDQPAFSAENEITSNTMIAIWFPLE